ncbi:MAG TPA: hypothetical protein VHY91_24460 [Pirellulales bacterium]|jgi:hypothetical protein|nr:hypothetical protein [Pirellulales bacterium]
MTIVGWLSTAAIAQPQPRIEAEGVPGKPFGVGVLAIELPRGQRTGDLANGQVALSESRGRIFYVAYETRPLARLLRGIAGGGGVRRLTVFFLFTGDQPLDLTLSTPQPIRWTLTPRPSPNAERLLAGWWREFSRRQAVNIYPRIDDYLTATLARRMNLPMPAETASNIPGGIFSGELQLLAGSESLRTRLARQALMGASGAGEARDQELPKQSPLAAVEIPTSGPAPAPEGVKPPETVEAIAMRVPEECFYVRYGSYTNFSWLRHRTEEWGGDARNLISEQAVDYGLNKRMQRQMGLQETALGDVLGPTVISDVAIVGSDMFVREGAALGVLFEARSNLLLGNGLRQQRTDLLKTEKGAKEEKLTLAGKEVSLISTPENRVRSFYVTDGDYHFITTSRTLVTRFLETGQKGKDRPPGTMSLGASAEFRYARTVLPLDRGDTAFIYLSRAFFHNLMSPHYQVEMVRRLRSATEMELALCARLLARSEGRPAETLEQLLAADVLPAGFGRQADGSYLELTDTGPVDSLRGARGTFVPIPDMTVGRITASEARQYQEFLSAAQWGPPDPLLCAIRQSASKHNRLEHVEIDLQAAPLTAQHYEFLNRWLGPPAVERLAPVAGNLVTFEAAMRGDGKFAAGDHFLFFGLQDLLGGQLPADDRPLLEALRVVTGSSPLRGYLGAWPVPGLLANIGGTADVPVDPAGYARLATGVWRRTFQQFTVMSFHREVLEQVTPQFRLVPSPRPVQIALRVDDLQGTNLSAWVNREGYERAAKMSEGNLRLLATLADEFRVPSKQCLEAAETLLDARLLDPLGGRYELAAAPGAAGGQWRSTRSGAAAPANYQFPALNWIRGLDAEAWFDQGRLVLHSEVEMPAVGAAGQKPDKAPAGGKAF